MNRRRAATAVLLMSIVVAMAGCRFAEWIGEQRALEQERRSSWSEATSGTFNGAATTDGR
jgi:hypothetical protein